MIRDRLDHRSVDHAVATQLFSLRTNFFLMAKKAVDRRRALI